MAGLDLDIVAEDDFILVDRKQLEKDFGKMDAFYFTYFSMAHSSKDNVFLANHYLGQCEPKFVENVLNWADRFENYKRN
jgi:hypothetical protein